MAQEENVKRKEAEKRAKEEAAGPNRRKRAKQWWEQELAASRGGQEMLDQMQDAEASPAAASLDAADICVCICILGTDRLSMLHCKFLRTCVRRKNSEGSRSLSRASRSATTAKTFLA